MSHLNKSLLLVTLYDALHIQEKQIRDIEEQNKKL
jgi:hypothetical protein